MSLGKGLRKGTPVRVWWPSRTLPKDVRVDGRSVRNFDKDGVLLDGPFRTLEARWQ
ncbi:hypothetical protein D3C72_2562130 [compost metagenome]